MVTVCIYKWEGQTATGRKPGDDLSQLLRLAQQGSAVSRTGKCPAYRMFLHPILDEREMDCPFNTY